MTYVVVVESHFSESNGAESEFGCPVSRISRNLGSWPSGISDFQDSWLAAHFFFTSSGCKMVYLEDGILWRKKISPAPQKPF